MNVDHSDTIEKTKPEQQRKNRMSAELESAARRLYDSGLCVLPGGPPKERRPNIGRWKPFQKARPIPARFELMLSDMNRAKAHESLCLICGEASGGVEVLDFDHKHFEGRDFYAEWRDAIPTELFDKLVLQKTQSNGIHAVYRVEGGCGDGNLTLALNAAGDTVIETRGQGGLVLVAPTPGYEMVQGDLADLPTITMRERNAMFAAAIALSQIESKKPKSNRKPMSKNSTSKNHKSAGDDPIHAYFERHTFQEFVERHGWKLLEDDGTQASYWRPGKRDGSLSATWNGATFYVFSTNAHPFAASEGYGLIRVYLLLEYGNDSDETLRRAYQELSERGYGEAYVPSDGIDWLTGWDHVWEALAPKPEVESVPATASAASTETVEEFPGRLLPQTGFLGEFVRHSVETAKRPQPSLALGAGLATLATLVSLRVVDDVETRPNIYVVGLGATGSGKDNPRSLANQILMKTDVSPDDVLGNLWREKERSAGPDAHSLWSPLVTAEPKSGQALRDILRARRRILCSVDEVGHLLKMVGSSQMSHVQEIEKNLLQLFTASGSLEPGCGYARNRYNYVLDSAHMNVLALGTPHKFWGALSMDSVANGLVGRFLIFVAKPKYEELRFNPKRPLPNLIVEHAAYWHAQPESRLTNELDENTGAPHQLACDPRKLHYSPEADELRTAFGARITAKLNATSPIMQGLYARCSEHAAKLALLKALSDDPQSEEVSAEAYQWGVDVVQWMSKRIRQESRRLSLSGASNSPTDRVKNYIRSVGDAGALSSDLYDVANVSEKFKALMESLEDQGIVTKRLVKSRTGRIGTRYWLLNDDDDW